MASLKYIKLVSEVGFHNKLGLNIYPIPCDTDKTGPTLNIE